MIIALAFLSPLTGKSQERISLQAAIDTAMKYKEAIVVEEIGARLKTVGTGLTKYRILVKGNKNPSVRYGHQLFVKMKHEDTI